MKLSRLLFMLLALVMLTGTAMGCGGDKPKPVAAPTAPMEATVEVFNDTFEPSEIKVGVGAKVTFKNIAPIEYHIHVDGLFNQVLRPGTETTQVFRAAGTFRVYDTVSPATPEMTVIVEGEDKPADAPKSK